MRKRDLAILMLSAFAIFFSLQHEGDFSFKEAWFHLSDEYPILYEADRLPPPIVADLNGDGRKEVLVATHDAKIQVLEPHVRRVDEGFNEARVLAEVSILPEKIRIATGRRAVAMATGIIDKNYNKREPRKQVLVVVTSGWSVMCFDHNLKKLWDVNLQAFASLDQTSPATFLGRDSFAIVDSSSDGRPTGSLSFSRTDSILDQFRDLRDDRQFKKDYPGACTISVEQGEELKKQIGAVAYIEFSAKTQQNVKAVFDAAIKVVLRPPRFKLENGKEFGYVHGVLLRYMEQMKNLNNIMLV